MRLLKFQSKIVPPSSENGVITRTFTAVQTSHFTTYSYLRVFKLQNFTLYTILPSATRNMSFHPQGNNKNFADLLEPVVCRIAPSQCFNKHNRAKNIQSRIKPEFKNRLNPHCDRDPQAATKIVPITFFIAVKLRLPGISHVEC